ncbi:MAG: ketopantoate reductase family protein [Caulobacteraceae bacterium]
MKKIENVYLIGLGAIGGSYAARLYDMNPAGIRIIADKERIKRYSQNPLSVNGKVYDFEFVGPGEKVLSPDLILVSVKYNNLMQAIKGIRNYVGENTIILSLMNGIDSEEIIGRELGIGNMLYSVCVAIDAVREGNGIRYSSFGRLDFGEKTNSTNSPRVERLKELFDRANIPYAVPEDMMRALWWKYMVNVGVNQVSAVLKATYGVFDRVTEARELMEEAMREVIALSAKVGTNLNENDLIEYRKVLRSLSPEGKTSMLQDVEAGRKTEVEMFSGVVCELGKKYGVETPVNRVLFKTIRSIEGMYLLN